MKDALFVVFLTNRSSGLAAAPRNFPLITLSLGNHQLFVIDGLHIKVGESRENQFGGIASINFVSYT